MFEAPDVIVREVAAATGVETYPHTHTSAS